MVTNFKKSWCTFKIRQIHGELDIHKKPQNKQNQTNPGLVASYDIKPGNRSGLF